MLKPEKGLEIYIRAVGRAGALQGKLRGETFDALNLAVDAIGYRCKMAPTSSQNGRRTEYTCPKCGKYLLKGSSDISYCKKCGQCISWEGVEE